MKPELRENTKMQSCPAEAMPHTPRRIVYQRVTVFQSASHPPQQLRSRSATPLAALVLPARWLT